MIVEPVIDVRDPAPDLHISGRLTDWSGNPGVTLVRLLRARDFETLAATYTNNAGYYTFKHGPSYTGEQALLIARKDNRGRPAGYDPVPMPANGIDFDFSTGGGGETIIYPQPILQGRLLYIDGDKIKALPVA